MPNVPKGEQCFMKVCTRRRAWEIRYFHTYRKVCDEHAGLHGVCNGNRNGECDALRKRDGNTGESCGETEIPKQRIQGR